MIRETPNDNLDNLANTPCLIVATACAVGGKENLRGYPVLKKDGYATLKSANKWIRQNLKIKKRTDYRRGERPKLKDLHLDGKAIVVVLGHYIYLDHERYWSFFDNENDDVVTTWEIKNEAERG